MIEKSLLIQSILLFCFIIIFDGYIDHLHAALTTGVIKNGGYKYLHTSSLTLQCYQTRNQNTCNWIQVSVMIG